MLVLLFSLLASAFAAPASSSCTLTEILKSDKPDRACVEAYLNKIKNSEDRGEAKFRLARWKPIKELKVDSGAGMIEAYDGTKFLTRAVLLQVQKPMMIWMDGKILTDNSENASFARRFDNAVKKNKSALLNFILPTAHAQSQSALSTTQQTLTMLYALDEPNVWNDAAGITQGSKEIENFIASRNRLGRMLFGAREVRCTSKNLVEPTEFNQTGSYSDIDTRLKITPKSANEFIVTGLQAGQTHVIKLSTWETRIPHSEKTQSALDFKTAAEDATISTCADAGCSSVSKTDKFDQWNYVLRKSPEADRRWRAQNSAATNMNLSDHNDLFRAELVGKLFGLSVLGSCCASPACREKMAERFGISLKNATPDSTTTY